MKKENMILWGMVVLFAVMMSVPFLVPHTGLFALFGFLPLLAMERIATMLEKKEQGPYIQDDGLVYTSEAWAGGEILLAGVNPVKPGEKLYENLYFSVQR